MCFLSLFSFLLLSRSGPCACPYSDSQCPSGICGVLTAFLAKGPGQPKLLRQEPESALYISTGHPELSKRVFAQN